MTPLEKTTTIVIDREVWRRLRIAAVETDERPSKLIERLVREWLATRPQSQTALAPLAGDEEDQDDPEAQAA